MFSSRENQRYYGFDVRFHTRVGESNWFVMFSWLITKHTSAGSLVHWQQTICWISAQTKLRSIYLLSFIVRWWNIERCLQFRRNSNSETCNWAYYFFTFRSWYNLVNSSQACGRRRETFKSWNAAISNLIIKITISLIVIGLKNPYFSTNSLAKLLLDSLLSDSSIGQSHS